MKPSEPLTHLPRSLIALVVLMGALGVAGPSQADQGIRAQVQGGLISAAATDPAATIMVIRVAGPDRFFEQVRDETGQIDWYLPGGAPDGAYRYDIYAAEPIDAEAQDSLMGLDTDTASYRQSGRFRVQGGVISVPERRPEAVDPQQQSRRDEPGLVQRVAVRVLNFLVPPSQAQLVDESSLPRVWFDDTDDEDCSAGSDWILLGEGGENDDDRNNYFSLFGMGELADNCADSIPIVDIRHDGSEGPDSSENSISIDLNGDMALANDSLFIDRSFGNVGIGTTNPVTTLEIVKADFPFLMLTELSGTTDAGIAFRSTATPSGNAFILQPDGDVVFLDGAENTEALTWQDGSNNIGIGADNPTNPLHVRRDGGGSSVAALKLDNPNGKLRFVLASSGEGWTFNNANGNAFTIAKIGTGARELEVDSNGNLTIEGTLTEKSSRAAKTRVEAVEPAQVLDKLAGLPLSEWTYTDGSARHLGPMAEDFHAAFGLGRDAKHIAPKDLAGVALTAAQQLYERSQQLSERNHQLFERNEQLRADTEALRVKMEEQKAELTELRNLVEALAAEDQYAMAEAQ